MQSLVAGMRVKVSGREHLSVTDFSFFNQNY